MEPAHERALRRLTRQLQKDPRGALVLASCADRELRAGLEERLEHSLDSTRSLVRLDWTTHPEAPWDEILRAAHADRTIVSVHYDAITPPGFVQGDAGRTNTSSTDHSVALLRLNIGRDVRAREGIGLLLWLAGPGPLEVIRSNAPDLWAHRTLAVDFPSAADFLGQWTHRLDHDEHNHEHLALRHLATAESSWLGPYGSIIQLARHARSLRILRRVDEFADATERIRTAYRESPDLWDSELPTLLVFQSELGLATLQEDWDALQDHLARANAASRGDQWPALGTVLSEAEFDLAQSRGHVTGQLDALDRCSALVEQVRDLEFDYDWVPLHRAVLHVRLGAPMRALASVSAAEETMSRVTDPLTQRRTKCIAHNIRAQCAAMLGRPDEALHLAWLAGRRLSALREWTELRHTLSLVRELYLELGLPGPARTALRMEIQSAEGQGDGLTRATLHREFAALALALGDLQSMEEHALQFFDLHAGQTGLHPVASLLRCCRLARDAHPYGVQNLELELERWPGELTEQLGRDVRPDARDRLLLERARWHALAGEHAQAASVAVSTLPLRRTERGPVFISASCVVAARAYRKTHAFDDARACLDEARSVLEQPPEEHRPFSAWKEVMLETAQLATAMGGPDAAWQAIDDALTFATQRRLKVERMRLLLEHARLEPESPRGREAADQSLELASEMGYLRDEGQIRLERATQAHRAGDDQQAHSELSEARWLLQRLGPLERRKEAEDLARLLEPE